jgi:transposase
LCSWKDVDHAHGLWAEFRQDVIDVARKGETPLAQIAKDFGLSVTKLKRWIAIAERKDSGAGPAAAESAEMRELKKRNRLLEQENEILRRAAACLARDINQYDLPAGHGSCRRRCSRGGDLQGVGKQPSKAITGGVPAR